MNKAALIEFMAKHTKLPKTTCKAALEAAVTGIEVSLKKNKNVVLTGFGTFLTTKRKARTGVNPATGDKMHIPAKKVAKFKAGKRLKGMIR